MQLYAADWGHGDKFVISADGRTAASYPEGMLDFIEKCSPCILALESSFSSFHVDDRKPILEAAAKYGCQIVTISPRSTANRRMDLALPKSDAHDAMLIWRIANEGREHQKKAHELGTDWHKKLSRVRDQAMLTTKRLRHQDWPKAECAALTKHLGTEFPPELYDVLWKNIIKKSWINKRVVPVIALAIATIDAGEGRKFFNALCGLFAHGYPNMVRSNAYWHQLPAYMRAHLSTECLDRIKLEKAARKLFNEAKEKEAEEAIFRAAPRSAEEVAVRKHGMKVIRAYHIWMWKQVRANYSAALLSKHDLAPDAGNTHLSNAAE